MRTVNDPYGGQVPLIDKLIGNSYRVVKAVYESLKEIRYVAANMEAIYAVANGTVRNQLLLTAIAISPDTEIDLPADFQVADIQALSVLILTEDGNVYVSGEDTFSWVLEDGVIIVTLVGSPPTNVVGGTIKCLITHQPSVI